MAPPEPVICSTWEHGLQGRKILSPPGMLSLPAYEQCKSGVAPDRVQTRVRVLP